MRLGGNLGVGPGFVIFVGVYSGAGSGLAGVYGGMLGE